MMCCDECDRGYHSFCVGLSEIPAGQCGCGSECGLTIESVWGYLRFQQVSVGVVVGVA